MSLAHRSPALSGEGGTPRGRGSEGRNPGDLPFQLDSYDPDEPQHSHGAPAEPAEGGEARRRSRGDQQVRERPQQRRRKPQKGCDGGGPGSGAHCAAAAFSAASSGSACGLPSRLPPRPGPCSTPSSRTPSSSASRSVSSAFTSSLLSRDGQGSPSFTPRIGPSSPGSGAGADERAVSSSLACDRGSPLRSNQGLAPTGLRTPPSFAAGSASANHLHGSPGGEGVRGNFQFYDSVNRLRGARRRDNESSGLASGAGPRLGAPQAVSPKNSPHHAPSSSILASSASFSPDIRGWINPTSCSPSSLFSRCGTGQGEGVGPGGACGGRNPQEPRRQLPQELYNVPGIPRFEDEKANPQGFLSEKSMFAAASVLPPNRANGSFAPTELVGALIAAAGGGAALGLADVGSGRNFMSGGVSVGADDSAGVPRPECDAAALLAALTEAGADASARNGAWGGGNKMSRAEAVEFFLRAAAAVASGSGGPGEKTEERMENSVATGEVRSLACGGPLHYSSSPSASLGFEELSSVHYRPQSAEKHRAADTVGQLQDEGKRQCGVPPSSSSDSLFSDNLFGGCDRSSPLQHALSACRCVYPPSAKRADALEASGSAAPVEGAASDAALFRVDLGERRGANSDAWEMKISSANVDSSDSRRARQPGGEGTSTCGGWATNASGRTPFSRAAGTGLGVFTGDVANSVGGAKCQSQFSSASHLSPSIASSSSFASAAGGGAWSAGSVSAASLAEKSSWGASLGTGPEAAAGSTTHASQGSGGKPGESGSVNGGHQAVGLPFGGGFPWSPASPGAGLDACAGGSRLCGVERAFGGASRSAAAGSQVGNDSWLDELTAGGDVSGTANRDASLAARVQRGRGAKRSATVQSRYRRCASVPGESGAAVTRTRLTSGRKEDGAEEEKVERRTGAARRSASCDAVSSLRAERGNRTGTAADGGDGLSMEPGFGVPRGVDGSPLRLHPWTNATGPRLRGDRQRDSDVASGGAQRAVRQSATSAGQCGLPFAASSADDRKAEAHVVQPLSSGTCLGDAFAVSSAGRGSPFVSRPSEGAKAMDAAGSTASLASAEGTGLPAAHGGPSCGGSSAKHTTSTSGVSLSMGAAGAERSHSFDKRQTASSQGYFGIEETQTATSLLTISAEKAGARASGPKGASEQQPDERGVLSFIDSFPPRAAVALWGDNPVVDQGAPLREHSLLSQPAVPASDDVASGSFAGTGAVPPVPKLEWLVQQRKSHQQQQRNQHQQHQPQVWIGSHAPLGGAVGGAEPGLCAQDGGCGGAHPGISPAFSLDGVAPARSSEAAGGVAAGDGIAPSLPTRDSLPQNDLYSLVLRVASELSLVSSSSNDQASQGLVSPNPSFCGSLRSDVSAEQLHLSTQGGGAVRGVNAGSCSRPNLTVSAAEGASALERPRALSDYYLPLSGYAPPPGGKAGKSESLTAAASASFNGSNPLFFTRENPCGSDRIPIYADSPPGLGGRPNMRMSASASSFGPSGSHGRGGEAFLRGTDRFGFLGLRSGLGSPLDAVGEEQGISSCNSEDGMRGPRRGAADRGDRTGEGGEARVDADNEIDRIRDLVSRWVGLGGESSGSKESVGDDSSFEAARGGGGRMNCNLSVAGKMETLRGGSKSPLPPKNSRNALGEFVDADHYEPTSGFRAYASSPVLYQGPYQSQQLRGNDVEGTFCSKLGRSHGLSESKCGSMEPARSQERRRMVHSNSQGNEALQSPLDDRLFLAAELDRCPEDIRELLVSHLLSIGVSVPGRSALEPPPPLGRAAISLPYNLEKGQTEEARNSAGGLRSSPSDAAFFTGLPSQFIQAVLGKSASAGDLLTPPGIEPAHASEQSSGLGGSTGSGADPKADALHAVVAKTKEMRWLQGLETFLEHQAKKGGGSAPEAMVAAFAAAGAIVGPLFGSTGAEAGLRGAPPRGVADANSGRAGGHLGRVATVPAYLEACASGAPGGNKSNWGAEFGAEANPLSWLLTGSASGESLTGRQGVSSLTSGKKHEEQPRMAKASCDSAGVGLTAVDMSSGSNSKPGSSTGGAPGSTTNCPNSQSATQPRRKAPRPSKRQRVLIRALAYVKQRIRVLEGEVAPLLSQSGLASSLQDVNQAPTSMPSVMNWESNK
ncbi:hypothetical protein BESB_058790 [Besnoitia besnoiti]|uniref:Uncharacterized protein n=1 Tax=Besnoitia besnoiti TaxID=94643 RepID=A0A2A9MHX2_BESBE|nr:hypothetical protein BESB_058790 [Besnoitia besnoiti]PFH34992.1 hypothetical protein BESB_058790 [Besnoitia besnoiti]